MAIRDIGVATSLRVSYGNTIARRDDPLSAYLCERRKLRALSVNLRQQPLMIRVGHVQIRRNVSSTCERYLRERWT